MKRKLIPFFLSAAILLTSCSSSGNKTTDGSTKLLFTLMSAIAQFERDVIADRTREGLNSARARGRKGGRPRTDSEKLRKAIKLYNTQQYSLAEIEDMTGVKRSTLYRGIRSKNG